MEARFKKGEKVLIGKFYDGKVTISNVYLPGSGIHMYQFEEVDFALGEIYLKRNEEDEDLKVSDCIDPKLPEIILNTIGTGRGLGDASKKELAALGIIFFRPDYDFVKWIADYAGDRVIVEVGSGTGHLLKMLRYQFRKKVMGIEPNFDYRSYIKEKMMQSDTSPIHIVPKRVEECGRLLHDIGEKALIVIARPCHSNFVENTIRQRNPLTEVLYITVPENIKKYCDLGAYDSKKILLKHEGTSEENEVVYSIPAEIN